MRLGSTRQREASCSRTISRIRQEENFKCAVSCQHKTLIHNHISSLSTVILFRFFSIVLFITCIAAGQNTLNGLDQAVPVFQEADEQIYIGVLAKRGSAQCFQQWGATSDYLTDIMPGYTFSIVPLGFDDVNRAVEYGEVDFVLANPSFYVDLEVKHGVSRIATLNSLVGEDGIPQKFFAGVLFCRADMDDIQVVADLKKKTFMAVHERSFGGWHMIWRELLMCGIDPYRDFASISFGGTHDAVVSAVLAGNVDVGTVRTGIIEQMAIEGRIERNSIRVLKAYHHYNEEHSCMHSTRHYPEWPFAKCAFTSDDLAEQVASALIGMPGESQAAKDALCAGWTIPQNYQPVRECLMDLNLSPYEDYGKIGFEDVVYKYKFWLMGILSLLTLVIIYNTYSTRLKLKLNQSEQIARERVRSNNLLQTIIDSLPAGIMVVDADSRTIRDVNPAAAAMIGLPREKIIGYLCHGFTCSSQAGQCPILDQGQNIDHSEGVLLTAGHGEIPILKTVISIILDGKKCLLESFIDISNLKEAEKTLQQAHDHLEDMVAERTSDLEEANEHLKDLDKLKSMFIASMSHELRTPLNSIIGFSGLLLQGLSGDLNAEQNDSLKRIYRSGNHLLELISDVIDISKIEAGRIDVYYEHFMLREVVEESVETIRPQVDAKGLILELVGDTWPEINTDRKRLLQCLLNFLSNAVKYTEKGKIIFSIAVTGSAVEFQVKDTGIGISDEDMNKLFEPFERLDTPLKVKAGGTGLGLYLTRKIAEELLHGSLSVESHVDVGSSFSMTIPVDVNTVLLEERNE